MHRTRTTAKILVGAAAVWAVSGCVAVEPVPAPPSPSGRPAQVVEPQIVQGPAREVLQAAPPDATAAAPPPPNSPRATAGTASANAPGERSEMGVPPAEGWGRSEMGVPPAEGWGRAVPRQPRPARAPAVKPPALPSDVPSLPALPGAVPVAGPDVCALGKSHGKWRPDSPEARICRTVYGN